MSNTQLHWVQLHVSTLCIGHHQVVLRPLLSNNTISRVFGGGMRFRLYNSGWHNLGLTKPDDGQYTGPKHVAVPNVIVYYSLKT